MAHVQWCVGNTTLREAARLEVGLRVLKKHFNGRPWSYENQRKFLELLQQEGISELGATKSSKQIEQHGRIWSSAFNELGFATCYKRGNKYVAGGVTITKAGEALLSNDYVCEDVWLRQLLKLQFPNPLPQKSKNQYPGFHLLPFQATLKIIKECNGISKDEGFVVNTLKTLKEADRAVKAIKKYREGLRKACKKGRDSARKYAIQQQCNMAKRLYRDEIKERLKYLRNYYDAKNHTKDKRLLRLIAKSGKGSNTAEATRLISDLESLKSQSAKLNSLERRFLLYYLTLKSRSWKDYIDLTIRYFRMSGILTVHRSKVTIAEDHKDIVSWILSRNWQLKKDKEYLDYLHDCTVPLLPQDKAPYLKQKVEKTLKDVGRLSQTTKLRIKPEDLKPDIEITDPLRLRKQLLNLNKRKRELKEYEYMLELNRSADAINEIVGYFDSIKRNDILGYRPTHFEWNIWRGFLAIDKLAKFPHECRNFDIDDDLQPRNFAPGGKPDMVFYYKDYTLVVEVTLSAGETQYNTEHEPVPRHVTRVMQEEKGKDIYCLFIAPQIQINTAVHFYAKMTTVPYISSKNEKLYPKIIPISLNEYILLLKVFQKTRYTPAQLRQLLDEIVTFKDKADVADGSDWLVHIRDCIEKWAKQV
ncbi:MAG: AlwI family type II restriction endonuclease [Omnitrophica bacterium]|nr:AlwI family type II restriction endonuclease [Candidatus Omnitrophota bacterium]